MQFLDIGYIYQNYMYYNERFQNKLLWPSILKMLRKLTRNFETKKVKINLQELMAIGHYLFICTFYWQMI